MCTCRYCSMATYCHVTVNLFRRRLSSLLCVLRFGIISLLFKCLIRIACHATLLEALRDELKQRLQRKRPNAFPEQPRRGSCRRQVTLCFLSVETVEIVLASLRKTRNLGVYQPCLTFFLFLVLRQECPGDVIRLEKAFVVEMDRYTLG